MNSSDGKAEQSRYRMSKANVRPLLKLLYKQKLDLKILDPLFHIVQYCLMGDFLGADDAYLRLSIGNSPWPMGVTMVGIHERSGRSRIYNDKMAHVLNDETQRKFLQSFKKLITICQKQS